MSKTTGAHTSTFVRHWRAIYDVAVGVTLFVSLLLPAVRQAGTGTLSGLRNGMLLLLLDVVVLVMLSRYITSPARERLGRRTAPGPSVDEPDAPGLTFTDTLVTVQQLDSTLHAALAWSDCAAVVHSQVVLPNGTEFAYLQFVAVHEGRIRRRVTDNRAKALSALLGLTESAASMVWVVPPQLVRLTPLVLAFVEQHQPHVRVVRPDVVDHAQ